MTPYYNRPTQRGLYEHFKAIAEAVAVPQILYNVPGRTAVDMSNDTVVRLAELENIVGIKDATGDLARGRELIQRCGEEIAIYSGDDPTAMELMLAGGQGNISVTANVAPALMAELCRLALAGEREKAEAINRQLAPLNQALFLEANPIPVKWAIAPAGLIGEGMRLPLTSLDEQYHARFLMPWKRREFDAYADESREGSVVCACCCQAPVAVICLVTRACFATNPRITKRRLTPRRHCPRRYGQRALREIYVIPPVDDNFLAQGEFEVPRPAPLVPGPGRKLFVSRSWETKAGL